MSRAHPGQRGGVHCMEEHEIAAAIGWMMVASGALAVMLSSVFTRRGYRATTAGLVLGCLGLFIAGHTWAAVVANSA